MIVKKCDICGREIGMVNAHYQLIFDGGFLRKEKDICIDCFKRIADEIKQTDTPQTETKVVGYCNECKWFRNKQVCGRCRSKNLFAEADTPQTDLVKESDDVVNDLVKDTPQTEICDTCKYRSSNVFGNWCVGRDTCDRYEADTPRLEITREEAEKIAERIKDVPLKLERLTDCGWGEPNE